MCAIVVEPFDEEQTSRLAGKIVKKLLKKKVIGGHKKQKTTVAKWFPSDKEGEVKQVIDEMVRNPTVPVEAYGGGHRENIRLSSFEKALEFVEEREINTQWINTPY